MARRRDARLEALKLVFRAGPAAPLARLNALRTVMVSAAARGWCHENSVALELLDESRLLQLETRALEALPQAQAASGAAVQALAGSLRGAPLEVLGAVLERVLDVQLSDEDELCWARGRKPSGSFFTPEHWTRHVMSAVLSGKEPGSLRILDPASGAGAFLLAAARALAEQGGSLPEIVARQLYGIDKSELALATSEACLTLLCEDAAVLSGLRRHLALGNALIEPKDGAGLDGAPVDPVASFPEVFGQRGGFDLVVGNPPWVAFAGRAAKPLPPEVRAFFRQRYRGFSGYPTLHALFIERAAELAPSGTVALLVPSPIADLDGYRAVRTALARTHTVREPLLELGQDAFAGVTQPCFVLLADPGPDPRGGDRHYQLSERSRVGAGAAAIRPPEVLQRLTDRPCFPDALFGEMGFQSSGAVSKRLFLRAAEPDSLHTYPLLEGRNVQEFRQGPPRLFLNPDPDVLKEARCRLRPLSDYQRAHFVVRQTAAWPIAALHGGLPFRNSLIAGFGHDEFPPEATVALLNSALYRALHLAGRRDARQATFPQMKVRHLRGLPKPHASPAQLDRLVGATDELTSRGVEAEGRRALDTLVFDLFDIAAADREAVMNFLAERAPKLYAPPS